MHVETFFARNLGDLICVRSENAGPAHEGNSRTMSTNADEESDEAIVLRKRPNKGRQLPAEVVEGRASPKGNSRQAAVARTLSRIAMSIQLAAGRQAKRISNARSLDVRPKGGARCVSSARRDLCGGRPAMAVPTATMTRRCEHTSDLCGELEAQSDRIGDGVSQSIFGKWLMQKCHATELHALHSDRVVRRAGHEDDGKLEPGRGKPARQFQPRHITEVEIHNEAAALLVGAALRNSSAEAKGSTRYPNTDNSRASDLRTPGSSSTTAIVCWCIGISQRLLALNICAPRVRNLF